jgi:hypothetical protein
VLGDRLGTVSDLIDGEKKIFVAEKWGVGSEDKLLREEETYKTGRASLYTASTILTMLTEPPDPLHAAKPEPSSRPAQSRTILAAQSKPSSRPAQSRTFVAIQPQPSSLRNPNLPRALRNLELSLLRNPNLPRAPRNPEPSLLRNPNLPRAPRNPEPFLALVVP